MPKTRIVKVRKHTQLPFQCTVKVDLDHFLDFNLLPGTILIFPGAAHQIFRQEKRAQAIVMIKTGT
jgi:hypothetical protein